MILAACGGGSGSSGPVTDPGTASRNALVYQSTAPDGAPSRLYAVNRGGESTLLSGAAAESPVVGYLVSPDARRVAYRYPYEGGTSGLAIARLDAEEPEQVIAITGEATSPPWLSWQWLPDSQGLVYVVFDSAGHPATLWLAEVGTPSPVELIGSEAGRPQQLRYAIAADGSRVAVVVEYLDAAAYPSLKPVSASLYMVDLAMPGAPVLVDRASGDANSFRVEWSPYTGELLYQRRLQTDIVEMVRVLNYPAGPLVLLGDDGTSRPIHEDDVEGILPLVWLDAARVLVELGTSFDVIATDGSLQATHSSTGSIVPSPDGRRLAFLDWTAPGVAEAYLLNLDTGDVRLVGPGGSYAGVRGNRLDSRFYWSLDGSWLVWDRRKTPAPGEPGDGFYAYSVSAGTTRLLTPGEAQYPVFFASWLPAGNVLQYLVQGENGDTATVTDLDAGRELVVTPACMLGQWLSNTEVLGKRCGEDLYVSQLDKEGGVTKKQRVATDVENFTLAKNHGFVVIQSRAAQPPDPANYLGPDWQLYDFSTRRLAGVQGTAGTFCCGTLLQ